LAIGCSVQKTNDPLKDAIDSIEQDKITQMKARTQDFAVDKSRAAVPCAENCTTAEACAWWVGGNSRVGNG